VSLFEGAGKYDDECTALRQALKAEGVVLIISGGAKGQGFSVQAPLMFLLHLPQVLRGVADEIDDQVKALMAEGGFDKKGGGFDA